MPRTYINMPPNSPIPSHITVLYVFTVFNLLAFFHISLVDAKVNVLDEMNDTVDVFRDLPASFGPDIPKEGGVYGFLVYSNPPNACEPIDPPPKTNKSYPWIVMISRSREQEGCTFEKKVLHAQMANYTAAIVHNVGSDDLQYMGGSGRYDEVKIPSVFVGQTDGLELVKHYSYNSKRTKQYIIQIDDDVIFDANYYLLPFAIVVGICFILMIVFMLGKWIRDFRKKRKNRLSKANLKKIPIKKFKKGETTYDTCAICLDEYDDGEKLRILPCSHAYHMKCVDPWLTNNKRVCPVCKRKVFPGQDRESDSSDTESDSDAEETTSERTPLLANQGTGRNAQSNSTFDNSGLPASMRAEVTMVNESPPQFYDAYYSTTDSEYSEDEQIPPSPATTAAIKEQITLTDNHDNTLNLDNDNECDGCHGADQSSVVANDTSSHSDRNEFSEPEEVQSSVEVHVLPHSENSDTKQNHQGKVV